MKRLFVFAFIIPLIATAQQPITPSFKKGKVYEITSITDNTITQEIMAKSVDIHITAVVLHSYEVKKVNNNHTTFFHKINRISISVSGPGDSKTIDTDSAEFMKSELGISFKAYLDQHFEITIDEAGNVVSVTNPKSNAERPALLDRIIKDMIEDIEAPKPGDASFFNWKKQYTTYTIKDANENYVIVDFAGPFESETTSETGGQETTTRLSGKYEGKIHIDKSTGLIKEETKFAEGTGVAIAMGQSIPIKNKTIATLKLTVR